MDDMRGFLQEMDVILADLSNLDFNNFDLQKFGYIIFSIIAILVILIAVLFIIGTIVDRLTDYKIKHPYSRTARTEYGAGEELFYRYWVWQGKKRKLLMNELARIGDGYVYPKERWRKRVKGRSLPFRREVYIGKSVVK